MSAASPPDWLVARSDFGHCSLCSECILTGQQLWPLPLKFESEIDDRFIIPMGKGYVHFACAEEAARERQTSLVRPDCKHWVRKGVCYFQDTCFFRHIESHRGSAPRGRQAKQVDGVKRRPRVLNDSKVFIFRRFLLDTFGREFLRRGSGVLDLAGGQGELSFQLVNLNHIPSTVVDPRPLKLRRFVRKFALGMYTRNLALKTYNDVDEIPDPSTFLAPDHLRTLFQVPAPLVGRKDPIPVQYSVDALLSEPSVSNLVLALRDPSTFDSCKRQAHTLNWTEKGLHVDKGSDTKGEKPDVRMDPAAEEPHEEEEANGPERAEEDYPIPTAREVVDFDEACALISNASCLVGMHPDQAACEAIAYAAVMRTPFAIVPCCVYGEQYPRRKLRDGTQVRSQEHLVTWLLEHGPEGTKIAELDFEGKNQVVYWCGDA